MGTCEEVEVCVEERSSYAEKAGGHGSSGSGSLSMSKLHRLNFAESERSYKIEARNLCYKLTRRSSVGSWFCNAGDDGDREESACILKDVNCTTKPREILAIAGPSGAGKSTLLEILAGRMKGTSGSIFINEMAADCKELRRITGYVTQNDALFPLLTVEETLMFSARLRVREGKKKTQISCRVNGLMKELGLEHVARTRIGNDKVRGISGGERRRVSIGVDVVHDPPVLVLDEPTSGLDSFSALHIIKILKSMAELRGRTVILSIHQPGVRILELFDSILLLSHGSARHHGSLQSLHNNMLSAGYQIMPHVNILEYAMDTVGSLRQTENLRVKVTLYDLFLLNMGKEGEQVMYELEDPPRFSRSRAHEILVLSQRFVLNVLRSKQLFSARTVQAAGAGVCLGSIFYKSQSAGERLGLFAFSLSFLLSCASEGLPIFVQEREILMRETYGGAYRVSSYVIANALVFLPFMLIVALLFSLPLYFLVGLNPSACAFFYFVVVVWLAIYGANSLVALLSAVVPDYIMGTTLIMGWLGASFLFSGFFVSKSEMPKYWMVMHYLSLFKYPLEGLLLNEYSDKKECLDYMVGSSGKCAMDVEAVMKQQGLHKSNKWINLLVMLAFISVYRFLSFVALRFRFRFRFRLRFRLT